eukprot:g9079.t1
MFVVRHAQSFANVLDPVWSSLKLPDPPLTFKTESNPGYHGREMAFAGGRRFALENAGNVMAEWRKFVFVVSPMRRTMETCALFIEGMASALNGLSAEDFAGRPRDEEEDAGRNIILAPELRESITKSASKSAPAVASGAISEAGVAMKEWTKPIYCTPRSGGAGREDRKALSQNRKQENEVYVDALSARCFFLDGGKNTKEKHFCSGDVDRHQEMRGRGPGLNLFRWKGGEEDAKLWPDNGPPEVTVTEKKKNVAGKLITSKRTFCWPKIGAGIKGKGRSFANLVRAEILGLGGEQDPQTRMQMQSRSYLYDEAGNGKPTNDPTLNWYRSNEMYVETVPFELDLEEGRDLSIAKPKARMVFKPTAYAFV